MNEVENSKITFSKHLFWDIDPENLDYEKNAAFVIKNVLLYGLYSDWKTISGYYGLARIMDVALKMRNLDLKTVSV